MTNSTPIYWEANGLSLHTYAWSVATFGGKRYSPPPKRGDDLVLPTRQGAQYLPKLADSREMPLVMWLVPLRQDGSEDPLLTKEQRLHKNWKTILDAVDVPGQFDLVKRWWVDDDVVSATGKAELLEGIEPDSNGYLQRFTLNLEMSDPYFYGTEQTVSAGSVFTAVGDKATDRVTISVVVTGACRIDFSDGNWFTYAGPAGTLVIDSHTGLVKLGGVPVNGLVNRNKNFGAYALITPGSYEVVFTSGISSGTVKYYPAYR